MDKKIIFIQVPDNTSTDEADALIAALKRAELPYSFVIVPRTYDAMSANEVRNLLRGMLTTERDCSEKDMGNIVESLERQKSELSKAGKMPPNTPL